MRTQTSRPDDATLRKFRLGMLPPDEAARVEQWVAETPSAADELSRIDASDRITDALNQTAHPGTHDTSVAPGPLVAVPQLPSRVSPVPDLPAELGGFVVVRELGRGGMGVVLEARDPNLDRLVALKLIAAQFADDAGIRTRFLQEARAVAKINHDNVVPVLQVGGDEALPFIVMPLLKGETLDARLKREGKLSAAEVKRIGRDVAAGLAAAHAVGIVHRDVKPGNVWLDADTGRARILDFGLAKPLERVDPNAPQTRTGAVLGTPHYMAPEQAAGKPVDSRADLFSLGVVLYHAATGVRPFTGDSVMAILTSLAVDHPPAPAIVNAEVPSNLSSVITALLEKHPDSRPSSATEVIERLDAPETPWEGIDEQTEEIVSTSKVAPLPPRKRPTRWKRAALALGLLLALGAAVVVIRDKDGNIVGQIVVPEGGSVEVKPGGPGPAQPATDADRKAAEWVLSIGGTVRVEGLDRDLKTAAELPAGFRLTRVDLSENAKVDDAGLACLAGCRYLKAMYLNKTRVTDAGLAHLRECKNLTTLDLGGTDVTPVGIIPLKALRNLSVGGPKFADAEIKQVAAALPRCRIDWTGGIVLPKPDYDREAAELAVKLGGVVNVDDLHTKPIHTLDELPQEPFRLTRVIWHKNPNVTDAALAPLKNCQHLTDLSVAGMYDTSTPLVTDAGLANFKGRTNLKQLFLGETQITDAGLANFKDCKSLTRLGLAMTATTDAGLIHFKDCADLEYLDIHWTGIADAGVAYFKNHKKLAHVILDDCPGVTDAAIDHLKGCSNLTYLGLKRTKITEAKIAELAKALPRCKIEWGNELIPGGLRVIEPKQK